jgi:folate-binding protein YgfZ
VSPFDQAARSGAVLAPAADLGTLSLTGPDGLTWLQGIVTCDVSDAAPGTGRWGLVLTRQGKILTDVLVVAGDGVVHLGLPRAALNRTLEYLQSFLIMEDADLSDDSARYAWLSLHGPRAAELATRIAARVPAAHGAIDMTGLGGAAVVVPRSEEGVARHLAVAEGAVPASDDDWLRLRVERVVPVHGVDMDDQRSPHDVSLERRVVSWSKGCYLGQEAVCMQDMRGKVKRRLVVLRLPGGGVPASGSKVFDRSSTEVGETRSAANSAVFGAPVALAFLAAASAAPGNEVLVDGSHAEVVEPR